MRERALVALAWLTPSISTSSGLDGLGLMTCEKAILAVFKSDCTPGYGVVGLRAHSLGNHYLQNQVRAALKVESQMNPLGERCTQGRARHARGNSEDAVQKYKQDSDDQQDPIGKIFLHFSNSLVLRMRARRALMNPMNLEW